MSGYMTDVQHTENVRRIKKHANTLADSEFLQPGVNPQTDPLNTQGEPGMMSTEDLIALALGRRVSEDEAFDLASIWQEQYEERWRQQDGGRGVSTFGGRRAFAFAEHDEAGFDLAGNPDDSWPESQRVALEVRHNSIVVTMDGEIIHTITNTGATE